MEPGRHIPHPPVTGAARWILLSIASLFLLLGLVGLFLPVMPTVPFLLVAAWAAARSSPRLHEWLETHPQFGHHICNWRDGGVVPRRAKVIATVMMSCSAVGMLVLLPQQYLWMAYAIIAVMAVVGAWLWFRPERCS